MEYVLADDKWGISVDSKRWETRNRKRRGENNFARMYGGILLGENPFAG
jgi:hypothetical protein